MFSVWFLYLHLVVVPVVGGYLCSLHMLHLFPLVRTPPVIVLISW